MNLVIRFMPAVLDPRRFLPFPGRKARIGFRGGGPGAVDSTYRFFVPMGWVDDVGVSFGLGALFRWLLLLILIMIFFFLRRTWSFVLCSCSCLCLFLGFRYVLILTLTL
jgi:hypothetical protein